MVGVCFCFGIMYSIQKKGVWTEMVLFNEIHSDSLIEENNSLIYQIKEHPGHILYMKVTQPQIEGSPTVYRNGEFVSNYKSGWMNHNVISLGNMEQQQTITVNQASFPAESVCFYELDVNMFAHIVQKIKDNSSVVIESWNDGKIVLTDDGEKNIFLSIPYDENWEALVDGEKIQLEKGAGAFIVIPAGEKEDRTILLEYQMPGNDMGICISMMAIIILAGWMIIERIRSCKKGILKT